MRWQGQDLRIVTGIGPERIGKEWWREPRAQARAAPTEDNESGPRSTFFRDYFRVQDHTGRWLWVFRAESRWFVHGFWA